MVFAPLLQNYYPSLTSLTLLCFLPLLPKPLVLHVYQPQTTVSELLFQYLSHCWVMSAFTQHHICPLELETRGPR